MQAVVRPLPGWCGGTQFGQIAKTRQKFVKMTDHTLACNDLSNFECEA